MNVLIMCFSQTGNTKAIADKIRNGIVDSGNDCDLSIMKNARHDKLKHYDLIGIGTPTFFYREPFNVRAFIHRMNKENGKHCFLFCTHGSIIGNTFYYMQEGLKEKGYMVIDTFDTYASSSLQFYPEVMQTTGHPDKMELAEAEQFGKDICNRSTMIQNAAQEPVPEYLLIEDTWWAQDSRLLDPEHLGQLFPKFTIDSDKCTQCGMCQENCPVDAIDMDADPPEIQKDGCIYCMYCEKLCPERAILADWDSAKKLSRGNLKKYAKALKEAEEQGRFRPYVEYEKII